jgi:hypothetical protein
MLENFAAIGLGGLRRFNVGELAAGSVFKILFLLSWGLYHKTYYGLNLRSSIISLRFVPGKPFQPGLGFARKARAYPSEAPFRCSTLG